MSKREEWIHRRLLELDFIAETRELDIVEKAEEKRLDEELKAILASKQTIDD